MGEIRIFHLVKAKLVRVIFLIISNNQFISKMKIMLITSCLYTIWMVWHVIRILISVQTIRQRQWWLVMLNGHIELKKGILKVPEGEVGKGIYFSSKESKRSVQDIKSIRIWWKVPCLKLWKGWIQHICWQEADEVVQAWEWQIMIHNLGP